MNVKRSRPASKTNVNEAVLKALENSKKAESGSRRIWQKVNAPATHTTAHRVYTISLANGTISARLVKVLIRGGGSDQGTWATVDYAGRQATNYRHLGRDGDVFAVKDALYQLDPDGWRALDPPQLALADGSVATARAGRVIIRKK